MREGWHTNVPAIITERQALLVIHMSMSKIYHTSS